MKEIIEERILGDIYYYDSTRVNLGLFQHDVNVIWDLAPHRLLDHELSAARGAGVDRGLRPALVMPI